jgi:aminoglycoside 6'-N-acetyltransferase
VENVSFWPVGERDFPTLARWLAEPHVRRFYQKTLVTLREVAAEYGPAVRGEEPTLCHPAPHTGTPFAYVQCYRNADYPEWAAVIGAPEGLSIDLYIGDPMFLHRGLGRGARWVSTPGRFRVRRRSAPALRCSEAVGFRRLRTFLEGGIEMVLLVTER